MHRGGAVGAAAGVYLEPRSQLSRQIQGGRVKLKTHHQESRTLFLLPPATLNHRL